MSPTHQRPEQQEQHRSRHQEQRQRRREGHGVGSPEISFSDHTPRQKAIIVASLFGALIIAVLCFVFAYYLLHWIYTLTGTPPKVATSVLTTLTGVVIAGVVFKLMGDILLRLRPDRVFFFSRSSLLSRTVDALEKIAQGEFDVSVHIESNDADTPLANLAESVNSMANKLGTMENLRQEFVSNVSHEIQSPLTSITGFAELLKKEDLTREQRDHYIDIIETESRRLSKLSDNLLKLSSLDSKTVQISTQRFRLDEQIEKAVLLLEPQWSSKDLEVSLSIPHNVSISGDEDLLEQVWVNLLTNAIKFTSKGGKLSIELTVNDRGDKQAGKFPEDAYVQVAITDSGIGIAAEDQIHLFERFFKADASRNRQISGNGLGLSLVQEIVTLHKGSVSVDSTLEEGSTFTVLLPSSSDRTF